MAKTIYKYLLDVTDRQTIMLPKGYKVLSIQPQKDALRLWAKIDTNIQEESPLDIIIIGTGRPLPDDIDIYDHFTTIEMCGGNLVWHIFIKKQ